MCTFLNPSCASLVCHRGTDRKKSNGLKCWGDFNSLYIQFLTVHTPRQARENCRLKCVCMLSEFFFDSVHTYYGASCPWGELSVGRVVRGANVPGANCPWGELSVGRNVRGAKCPWGEMSVGRNVRGARCRGASCPGARCPGASCPGASCLGASGPGTAGPTRLLPGLAGADLIFQWIGMVEYIPG